MTCKCTHCVERAFNSVRRLREAMEPAQEAFAHLGLSPAIEPLQDALASAREQLVELENARDGRAAAGYPKKTKT